MALEKRQNKNGTWSYRARVKDADEVWYPAKWFRSEWEAVAQESDLLKQKKQGARAFSTEDARTTLESDYWKVWRVENRTETSEGWKLSQDQMHRDYIAPVLGGLTLDKIGAPEIGRVLNRVKEMGRGDQTRKHVYSLVRQMFGDAVGYYQMLRESPVNPTFHRPKVHETEANYLPPVKLWALLEAARGEPAIWLESLAGLRTEAAIALEWNCILWDQDQILIRRAFKQKVRRVEEYPKGKKWVYAPMVPALKEYLEARKGEPNDLVCTTKGRMLKPETFAVRLKKLCREAGLPEISPHSLRHSCTELFVREGASDIDIQRLLNHKHASTSRRYMHRGDERLGVIAGRIQGPGLTVIPGGNYPPNYPGGEKRTYVSEELAPRKGIK